MRLKLAQIVAMFTAVSHMVDGLEKREAYSDIPAYRSRGKGKGQFTSASAHKCTNKFVPHQGAQERARRIRNHNL